MHLIARRVRHRAHHRVHRRASASRWSRLGTLAAGLAHELNNPAAAAVRTVDTMGTTLRRRCWPRSAELAAGRDHRRPVPRARRGCARSSSPATLTRSPMQVADAEEELADWLEDHGVDDPWPLAATLAGAGVRPRLVRAGRRAAGGPRARARPGVGRRHAARRAALLGELREATGRVSELVSGGALLHADGPRRPPAGRRRRGPREHAGDAPATSCATACRSSATSTRTCPAIDAYAGELNQVWTNLIDNAVDAMDGDGTLRGHHAGRATTRSSSRSRDTGPGLPPRSRPGPSTRSSPPRTSARAPASASTSPGASSSSATRAPSSWSAKATKLWPRHGSVLARG